MNDYVPAKDALFDQWFSFLNQYTVEKYTGCPPLWTHIPASALSGLAEAYANTLKPHTPVETEAKNHAKKTAQALIRPFVNQYLRYAPVNNEDRIAMGIPNQDSHPTLIPKPEVAVEADLAFPGVELVRIRPVEGPSPEARSDYGVRIYYGLSGPAKDRFRFRLAGKPTSGHHLPYSVFTWKKKEPFDFDGESGHTVYLCLCYENPTGQAGPFGPILKGIIP
jgi:hypothetical protein